MSSENVRRLRRLLDLRRHQEENTRGQLARSIEKAASISDEVRHRSEALEAVLRGSPKPEGRLHSALIADIAAPAIFAARAAEASARHAADELRRDWDRARRRVKGLERLDDNLAAAEVQNRIKQNRADLDDIISGRHRTGHA